MEEGDDTQDGGQGKGKAKTRNSASPSKRVVGPGEEGGGSSVPSGTRMILDSVEIPSPSHRTGAPHPAMLPPPFFPPQRSLLPRPSPIASSSLTFTAQRLLRGSSKSAVSSLADDDVVFLAQAVQADFLAALTTSLQATLEGLRRSLSERSSSDVKSAAPSLPVASSSSSATGPSAPSESSRNSPPPESHESSSRG
jgi:hypothetical protein